MKHLPPMPMSRALTKRMMQEPTDALISAIKRLEAGERPIKKPTKK